jgi:exo-1,4-beta-D-glucosaminidase
LVLTGEAGMPIAPVFWQDNFVSLLPYEKRTLTGAFGSCVEHPTLIVRGWNVDERYY